jgi:hypothetical protein
MKAGIANGKIINSQHQFSCARLLTHLLIEVTVEEGGCCECCCLSIKTLKLKQ